MLKPNFLIVYFICRMRRLMGKNQNRKTFLVNCHLNRNFSCQLSLERHRKMKHQHCVEELINKRILSDLIARSCEKIIADQCFPASTRQAFDNFILNDQETENIFKKFYQLSSITLILINIFSIHLIYIQKISFSESRLVPRVMHCCKWS